MNEDTKNDLLIFTLKLLTTSAVVLLTLFLIDELDLDWHRVVVMYSCFGRGC
jgi:hypothetical protein